MKQIETLPNLTEQAYQAILQEICDGSLPPGTHLVQENLAAQLGVSRQPIQQAMTLLKADGMVEEVGRRGLRVAELDLNLMQYHYDIRAALDGRAARGAALRCADAAFAEALRVKGKAIVAEGRKAVRDEAIGDMIRHDEEFHYLIYEASGNPLLPRTAEPHWRFLRRAMGEVLRKALLPKEIWRQHADILSAVLKADPDQAERLATDHVLQAAEKLVSAISDDAG